MFHAFLGQLQCTLTTSLTIGTIQGASLTEATPIWASPSNFNAHPVMNDSGLWYKGIVRIRSVVQVCNRALSNRLCPSGQRGQAKVLARSAAKAHEMGGALQALFVPPSALEFLLWLPQAGDRALPNTER